MIAEMIDRMGWDIQRATEVWSAEQTVELLRARIRRMERESDMERMSSNLQNLSGVL